MRQRDEKWKQSVTLFGEIVMETDQAIRFSDGILSGWVPKSEVTDCACVPGGLEITIPEWLAIRLGFA